MLPGRGRGFLMRPIYIMLIGLPASGKSTLAARIRRQYPDVQWWKISTDDYIDAEAANRGLTYTEVFKDTIDAATKHASARRTFALGLHGNIIHDQTNLTIKSRARKLIDIPPAYIKVGILCDALEMMRRQRLLDRPGKVIPDDIDARMRAELALPSTPEFDAVGTAANWQWLLDSHLAPQDNGARPFLTAPPTPADETLTRILANWRAYEQAQAHQPEGVRTDWSVVDQIDRIQDELGVGR